MKTGKEVEWDMLVTVSVSVFAYCMEEYSNMKRDKEVIFFSAIVEGDGWL